MIDATVLFLTFTDQQKLGFSGKMSIDLNFLYDLDDNWYGPMCQVFSNVIRYDTYRGANIGGICGANREIIEIAEIYHPKYVIYPCHFTGIVTEATLLALRKIGCIVVGYFFDDDAYFEPKSRWMIPYADYFVSVIHTPNDLIAAYQKLGAHCIIGVPPPINPAIFCKLRDVEKIYNATFIGALKANRSEFLSEIVDHGGDVKYLGGGYGKKMHWMQLVKIYNQSRINLSFSAFHHDYSPAKRRIVNRVYEVTLSGGFLLAEYAPGLEDYFEIGKEIVCFDTAKEAAEKIQYYLNHPDEREQIAEYGHRRALRDYTGQTKFRNVFSEIENDLLKCGRPEIIPETEEIKNTILYQTYASEYFKWVCALRKSPPPLRDEWYATAKLVLDMNPQHKEANRLLKRSEKWGYPEPLVIKFCVAVGHILITIFKVSKSRFASVFRVDK